MNKYYCKYHPKTPSRLYCPSCGIRFCAQCVKPNIDKNLCPICKEDMESTGISNTITPFWERLPRFFAYPTYPKILIFLIILALLSIAAIASQLLSMILTFLMLKYGYVILAHTAEGKLTPPTVSVNDLKFGNNLPFQQVIVFWLMLFIVGQALAISTALGIIIFLFLLFSVPASVMVMAIDKNVLKALNPLTLMGIISRVGKAYFILYAFLLLLSAAAGVANGLLAPILPVWLLVMMGTFVFGYFTLIMFNMMGYLVYQYHEELGFDCVYEFDEPDTDETGPKIDPFLSEINILIAEGMIDEAKKRLKRTIAEAHTEVLEYHQHYHKLLLLTKDKPALIAHGEPYMTALIHSTQPDKTIGKAVKIYEDCIQFQPDFSLSKGHLTYELAAAAHRQGKYDLALKMLNKFAQRYPDDPDHFPNPFGQQQTAKNPAIPKAYFLGAIILVEQKHQPAQAQKILTSLLRQFPTHPLIPEVKEYLAAMKRGK